MNDGNQQLGSDLALTHDQWGESTLTTNVGDHLEIDGHTIMCQLVLVAGLLLAWMPVADIQMIQDLAKHPNATIILGRSCEQWGNDSAERTLLGRPVLFLKVKQQLLTDAESVA